jgi:hypothetical protein
LDGKVLALDCIVVENLFKATYHPTDMLNLARLRIEANTRSTTLSLSFETPPPGAIVDVIGYPGPVTADSLKLRTKVNDIDRTVTLVTRLLPANRLCISRGIVTESREGLVSYKASTCAGMSGACVIYITKKSSVISNCLFGG